MRLHKKIIEVLEKHGFSIGKIDREEVDGEYVHNVDIRQTTPTGEDWFITIYFRDDVDFIDDISDLYESFDVDEDVMTFIDSAGRNGVPSIRELVKNAEWKEKVLEDLVDELNKLGIRKFEFYTDEHVTSLMNYLTENFTLSTEARALILQILNYVAANSDDGCELDMLEMFLGVIGVERDEIEHAITEEDL